MRRAALLLLTLMLTLAMPLSADAAAPTGDRIALPDGFAPEGIEAGRGTTLYVGSLADGSIWRGDARTGRGTVWVQGAGSPTVGLAYDQRRKLLWAAGGPSGEVRAYSTVDGSLVRTYTFAGSGFLNDLTITRTGVYVTDSLVQRLAVVPFGDGGSLPAQGRTLALTGDLQYVPGEFNANGIVDSQGYLVVAQSVTNALFRVDPDTGTSLRIATPPGAVSSPDGLELRGRTLYVVRNDAERVAVLRLGSALLRAVELDQLTGDTDVPTTATLVGRCVLVVNARFGTPVTPTTSYWISTVR